MNEEYEIEIEETEQNELSEEENTQENILYSEPPIASDYTMALETIDNRLELTNILLIVVLVFVIIRGK